jgi:hypothetical protein
MISDLFAQFIKEKRFLDNLSEHTIDSYQNDVFRRWMRFVGEMPIPQTSMNLSLKCGKPILRWPPVISPSVRSMPSWVGSMETNTYQNA